MKATLSYIEKNSFIHQLTGTTKLLFFLLWSIAAMITYDTRILIAMFIAGSLFFSISKLQWKDVSFAISFIAALVSLNLIIIYLFSPEQGVEIYGSRHEIVHLFWRYSIVKEQLFYLFNYLLKFLAVIPTALLFILTTNPSEFAASLNKIGVSYRIGYSVAIALRYVPDVQRDYHEISQAQQARGVDLSSKDGLFTRLKNAAAILFPLVLSTLERIEVISNAMELRGFGKNQKRSWIMAKPFQKKDYLSVAVAALALLCSIGCMFLNGGRYFNPFL